MGRSSIGLDIGTRAVSLAEVSIAGGKPQLVRFGRALLPFGAIDHGEIHDPQAVASTITTLWKKLGLTGKAVHVGLANRHVVVRVIEVPSMSKEDLTSAIRYQAQDHIPIPLSEAVMDFEVIEEFDRDDGKFQHVLVVAAERGSVQPMLEALQLAKLEALSLELNAYPLVRCFGSKQTEKAQAIVDVGAGVTTVVVQKDGRIRFTRILPTFGGEEFTKAIMEQLGVPREDAESLKRRATPLLRNSNRAATPAHAAIGVGGSRSAGYGQDADDVDDDGVSSDPDIAMSDGGLEPAPMNAGSTVELAANAVDPLLERFVTEIRGSLDFYGTQSDAIEIGDVVLTGGASLMGGIAERLSSSMGVPVAHGHPFENVPVGKIQVSPEEMSVAEPFIGLAIGLALAEVSR